MTLFFDTNVVIDVIARRSPFFEDSQRVFSLCESGQVKGLVSALTPCTVSYVLRKFAAPGKMRGTLRTLKNILTVVDTTGQIVGRAIDSDLPDFEDAVQFFSAVQANADYIVTRNMRHYTQEAIPVVTPSAWLALDL